VIKTCQHCGALNDEAAAKCSSCKVPLNPLPRPGISSAAATPTLGNLAVQPDWKREVTNRLHAYRARRHGGLGADLQSALPFESSSPQVVDDSSAASGVFGPIPGTVPLRPASNILESVGIPAPQYELALGLADMPSPRGVGQGSSHGGLLPVASLGVRGRAVLFDDAFLAFSYGAVLALFLSLGGHLSWTKIDLEVIGATFALFYAQYFTLFTVFGGSTPGMMLSGLRLVSFDGGVPSSRQVLWRSFGYLISAGTCFLGFLWALWDEEHLSWHDRISQTYLTSAEPLVAQEPPSGTVNPAGSMR